MASMAELVTARRTEKQLRIERDLKAAKEKRYAAMRPTTLNLHDGELDCGCFHPAKGKIDYCDEHKRRYPLATGVVKTIAEKKKFLEGLSKGV